MAALLVAAASAYMLPHTRTIWHGRDQSRAAVMGWDSANWNWGSAVGEAHDEAQRIRSSLASPEDRRKFLQTTAVGETPLEDVKMALALKCQRARNVGYDLPDGGWERLMEAMAECEFEGEDGERKLEAVIRERLKNQSALYPDATPREMMAVALNNLGFVERGL